MANAPIMNFRRTYLTNPDNKVPVGPRWAPCWPHEPCYQGKQKLCICSDNNSDDNTKTDVDASAYHHHGISSEDVPLRRDCLMAYSSPPGGKSYYIVRWYPGPYPPCVSMAGRALLAGYHRVVKLPWIFPAAALIFHGAPGHIQGNIDRCVLWITFDSTALKVSFSTGSIEWLLNYWLDFTHMY